MLSLWKWIRLVAAASAPSLLIAPSAAVAQAADPPPSIVLVLFDDLGSGDLEPYGGTFVATPHLSAIAAEGMRFDRFYASASACSPARAALLTGRHPAAVGIRHNVQRTASDRGLPLEIPTSAELLRQAGYATAHFGKWHVGEVRPEHLPSARGFEHSMIRVDGGYEDPVLWVDGEVLEARSGHLTDITTDLALDFIEAQQGPFFAQIWYQTPHEPLTPPLEWASRYPDTPEGLYAAMVAHGDHQIGRIVSALARRGIADRTLLLVTSDHGGTQKSLPSNGALRGYKGDHYEGGIRVPLLARWPGHVEPGATSSGVFAGVDVVPTLLDVAGLATQGRGLEGVSLRNVLLGGGGGPRPTTLFWEGRQPGDLYAFPDRWYRFAIRRGALKLVAHGDGRAPELYHLGIDPNETTDFAASQPALVRELVDEYQHWRSRVALVDTPIVATEGAARVDGDWLELNGGALRYEQDTRLQFADGDFTFQARVFPRRVDGEQVIAEHPGAWRLALDGGRLRLHIHHEAEGTTTIVGETVLDPGGGTEVSFTAFGARNGFSCLHIHVDGVLESQACVQGMSVSEAPLRLGADVEGGHAFRGWMWRPELRRNALLPSELADRDRDGVPDAADVCIGDADGPDAGRTIQLDVDGDGFGNACDADFDGDGYVGVTDFARIREAYGTEAGDPGYDAVVDLDGDGAVAWNDYGSFRRRIGRRPGPSALACGGALDCYGD